MFDPVLLKTFVAVAETLAANWSSELIIKSAERFSQDGFARRLREIGMQTRTWPLAGPGLGSS